MMSAVGRGEGVPLKQRRVLINFVSVTVTRVWGDGPIIRKFSGLHMYMPLESLIKT